MSSGRIRSGAWAVLATVAIASTSAGQEFEIDRSTIDGWIFQTHGTAEQAREALKTEAHLKIRRLAQVFGLDDLQEQQLELAAQGDVKRFFDRWRRLHAEIEGLEIDRNNLHEIYQRTLPLQADLRGGLLEEDSLLEKVLHANLTAEQLAEKSARDRAERQQMIETSVNVYISTLTYAMPLTAEQRKTLAEWLTEAVQDDAIEPANSTMLLLYRLGTIPPERLRQLLDEPQMRVVEGMRAHARGVEAHLRGLGILAEEKNQERLQP